MAACTSTTAPKPEAKKVEPPKPVTGLSGVFHAYRMARTWASDAMPLHTQSVNLQSVKSDGGKAGAWTTTFVSPSLRKSRRYSYSTIEGEGLHKDVFAQREEFWSGPTRQSMPFRIEALKTDTDKAWEVAVAKSAAYMKKNPDMPVFFVAEYTSRFPNPAWRVVWGESVSRSSYSIFVDTTDGKYLLTGR